MPGDDSSTVGGDDNPLRRALPVLLSRIPTPRSRHRRLRPMAMVRLARRAPAGFRTGLVGLWVHRLLVVRIRVIGVQLIRFLCGQRIQSLMSTNRQRPLGLARSSRSRLTGDRRTLCSDVARGRLPAPT